VWRRVVTGVLIAGTVAGGVIVSTVTGGLTANLWVDQSAGSCTDSAGLVVYVDANSCGTWDAALDAAECGDVIGVRDTGSAYSAQTLTGTKGCTSDFVTFQAEDGVEVLSMIFNGTSDIALNDFTVRDPGRTCNVGDAGCANDKIVDIDNSDSINADNVDISRDWQIGDGLGMNGGATNIVWANSDICCNLNQKLVNVQAFNGNANAGLDFIRLDVHGQAYDANTYAANQDPHPECWYMMGPDDVSWDRTRTFECAGTGNMNWGGPGTLTPYLMTQTVWGQKYGFVGGVDVVPGAGVGYRAATPSGSMIDGFNTSGVGTIEYSFFEQSWVCSNQSSITFRGNLGVGCGCTYTEAYNRWTNQACGGTDVQDTGAIDASRFIDRAGSDFRPASGSVAQVNAGDPGSCPSSDLGGLPRPVGGTCDQGPYEWQG
jgi:hypothetical protein